MKMPAVHQLLPLIYFLLADSTHAAAEQPIEDQRRDLSGKGYRTLELTVTNLSFQQPFSEFFVMVHSDKADPLYRMGEKASRGLRKLAEDGSAAKLIQDYKKEPGVLDVFAAPGPVFGGESTKISVNVNDHYNLVTLATMAVNTNDCFMAVNGMPLESGYVLDLPGLDAGTEENNELCSSIPGPACGPGPNVRSKNGEGFVHVHRGFHGINEGDDDLPAKDRGANGQPLSAVGYDWRNPMMRVTVH